MDKPISNRAPKIGLLEAVAGTAMLTWFDYISHQPQIIGSGALGTALSDASPFVFQADKVELSILPPTHLCRSI